MEKYLTGMRRQAERDGDKETNESLPKAKTRKYDEAYVALGFTVTTVGDEERPVCLLCLKMLAADSMKPNKLRCHLKTLHPNHADKPLEFFFYSLIKDLILFLNFRCTFQMHFKSFLLQLIKLFFVVSWSIFLSFFLLFNVNKDTLLCRRVLITIL